MEHSFRGAEKVLALIQHGARVPNPGTLDIGEEVDLARIAAEGLVLYPGCRIYGRSTAIGPGVRLGEEGPVTIEDCQLGPGVELKGGYFRRSVFLEKANMGLGAQVREACILEEEANGAHSVGIKQTILFPFVTLGSLINFCDVLLAGGTSRKNHSEVGSSYIHFNYTPNQDKATPSLLGDVPRGVMLDQPPIFLGGQGGLVGPARLGFGTVVAAGTVLRRDSPEDGKLLAEGIGKVVKRDFVPGVYRDLDRILRNNITFFANLRALELWYREARRPFLVALPLGETLYEGALDKLALARKERLKRLGDLLSIAKGADRLRGAKDKLLAALADTDVSCSGAADRDVLVAALDRHRAEGLSYLDAVRALDPAARAAGTGWLQAVVAQIEAAAHAALQTGTK